jgi:hypothetical protein
MDISFSERADSKRFPLLGVARLISGERYWP